MNPHSDMDDIEREAWEDGFSQYEETKEAVEVLANKVVNLALKIDEIESLLQVHLSEPDAHNPAIMRRKK